MSSANLPQPPLTSFFLTGLTRSILMFHSRGKASSIDPPFLFLRSLTPLTFQFPLASTHSRVRRTFSGASTCPGVTSPPSPDALRAFNLPQFAYAKRSCNLLLPVLAQGEEDFKSLLGYTRSRRGGIFNLFSPTPARGEEVLKNFILYLRSPAGDEGFRTMCFKTLC